MHDPYAITTLTTHPAPAHGAVMVPAELPPGVTIVTLPNGIRTLAYTHPTTPTNDQTPPPVQPVPAWAKTTALLAPTVGTGIGTAGVGLSYAAPGLIAMTNALWSAAALIVAAVIAVPVITRTARRATSGSGERTTTHITQNITANGLFGRANGTINNR
ncbi:hypothetical protein [Streptomyces sp. NPDC048057]|uniref:hypothetical protein n=1 Tax=Streptomyces sp. NPDC048057 TaxID=3155628 RepID=UPI003401EABE